MTDAPYLQPGRIGKLSLKNRLVRAATSETMATASGEATDRLVKLYADLAAGGAGLMITGHMFVEPRGQYEPMQTAIYSDAAIAGLKRVTDAVHARGGVIFAELSHAGSQSVLPEIDAIAPSLIPNAIYARQPKAMSSADVDAVVAAFGAAARRAMAAGFDGIHIHGANGYLVSAFNSPHANRRTDGWGGDAERRSRFLVSVYQVIRAAVGPDVPVTARVGMVDTVEGGLTLEESVERVAHLESLGLDAVEVQLGVMGSYLRSVVPYAGVTRRRALADGLLHRLTADKVPEAYFRPYAQALKARVGIPVILVGGVRSTEVMTDVLQSGDADFLAMARPFVREPDLPAKLAAGKRGLVDCVSCNICLKHEGRDPLRCWRTSASAMAFHVYCRLWRDRRGAVTK
jgi:2,4-dienoyl-CoA reductase-like NADH-dependent reductase (Old Yellow Enzyme family)